MGTQTPQITPDKLPVIDMSGQRGEVSKLMVKACEEMGFFKVINHGVPMPVVSNLEDASCKFFAKTSSQKEMASEVHNPPYGYGCKNIGLNGDVGEVEYLILRADPRGCRHNISFRTKRSPLEYRSSKRSSCREEVSGYVEAVRELASDILDMMGEGLGVPPALSSLLSSFIRDPQSDSLLRLNHYPPLRDRDTSPSSGTATTTRIGFGEHTDPQILTILRSNNVPGLQISVQDGTWVPVPPHPTAFFVNVGDMLQAMTNGRFLSVRHRAMVDWNESRMSMAYFASPPLGSRIGPLPNLVTPQSPRLYRSFIWAEYKKATYSGRLGDSRLNFFRIQPNDENYNKRSTDSLGF